MLIDISIRDLNDAVKERHLNNDIDAESFIVNDVADYFTATNIEGVLAEIYSDLNTIGIWSLTSDEVTQLQNIDTTTISTTQWGYLGELDQSVKVSSAPTFTADNFSDGGTNAIITTTQETNFESAFTHIIADGTSHANVVLNDTHRGSNGSDHSFINQSVISTSTPSFNSLTLNNTSTSNSSAVRYDQLTSMIAGLDWQRSVLDITTNALGNEVTGNRYISIETSGTWTIHYIYEWSGLAWIETIPDEGYTCWVEDVDTNYTFNGTVWVEFGSTVSHNNTTGLQGGTTDEYYHFTSTEYTNKLLTTNSVTDLSDVTGVGSGVIISSVERTTIGDNTTAIGFNTTHRGVVTGNPHIVTATEVGLGNVDNIADTNQILLGTVTTGDVTAIDSIGKVASKASGDIFYWTTALQRLSKGIDDQILTLATGVPSWADAPAGYSNAEAVAAVEAAGLIFDVDKNIVLSGTGTVAGILHSNLVDKSATEDISAIWSFSEFVKIKDVDYLRTNNLYQAYISFKDSADAEAGWFGYGGTGNNKMSFYNSQDDIIFYAAGTLVTTFSSTTLTLSSGKSLAFTDGGSVNIINTTFVDDDTSLMTSAAIDNLIDVNAYSHPTGDGNLHVPANSTTNEDKILTASATAGVYTWETPAAGGVTAVTATAPVASTEGTTPVISMTAATDSVNGYMTSTDHTSLTGKANATEVVKKTSTKVAGQFDTGAVDPSSSNRLNYDGEFWTSKLYGAVYNDYADSWHLKEGEEILPGKVYKSVGKYSIVCDKRADKATLGICSDTFGILIGSNNGKLPIAVAGFVLAHVDKTYKEGTPLVSNKFGKLTKARFYEKAIAKFIYKEEELKWKNIKVKGRCWVKIIQ